MTILTDDAAVRRVQTLLAQEGLYTGQIDGQWGGASEGALREAIAGAAVGRQLADLPSAGTIRGPDKPLAWGAKVSATFRARVRWMADALGVPADDIMAAIAWESGRTFDAAVKNMAGSGATGLIQFMPKTALALGTTTAALARMSAEDQLNYVYKYFLPYKGRLKNLGDLYMAILWPAGVGRPDSFVLWERGKHPTTYRQNAGLDLNRDAAITRGEALAKVTGLLAEGRKPGNLWTGG